MTGVIVGAALALTTGCAEGTQKNPFEANESDSDETDSTSETTTNDAGLGPQPGERPPAQVDIRSDAEGAFAAPAVGFDGSWTSNVSVGSTVSLRFEDGNVCMSGESAQVIENDYTTYFGAEATFTLCRDEGGTVQPVQDCLGRASEEFVGIKFTLENQAAALPIVFVRFNEAGRESPTAMIASGEQEIVAFFHRQTNFRDSSAPPPTPGKLESITVRAAGNANGPQSFDFCFTEFSALFGDAWEAALIPDWIEEPGPGLEVAFAGVNLVGAEFGEDNLPGTYGTDYVYPSESDMATYADRGMNIIRLPFKWERLQQDLAAALNETELDRLKNTVTTAKNLGLTVILDPHNFARYVKDGEELLVGDDVSDEQFADFWARVATEFSDDDEVWFGLMNEPHDMPTEDWVSASNAAIAAIRDVGANNRILVPGNQWTGAHAWFADYYGTPNAEALLELRDPEDNLAIELHQYFDANYSGTANLCVSDSIGVETVGPVTEWLKESGFKGFFGEFGGSDDPVCLGAANNLLQHLGENRDVWLGWTVWAASPWTIQHNVRPLSNGEDVLQMRVLLRHLN